MIGTIERSVRSARQFLEHSLFILFYVIIAGVRSFVHRPVWDIIGVNEKGTLSGVIAAGSTGPAPKMDMGFRPRTLK